MSVLPNSATFASFFVVLAISLLLTILLGLNLPALIVKLFHLTQGWSPRARLSLRKSSFSLRRPTWTKIDYIEGYVDILNPTIELEYNLSRPGENWGDEARTSWLFLFFWYLFRWFPVLVLHYFLANEVNFPFNQWFLFQYRHNPRMDIYYHWVFFVRDFFRFILLLAWVVLGGAVLCYLVIQDVLGLFFIPVLRPVLQFVLPVFTFCFAVCFTVCSTAVDFFWHYILRRPSLLE